MWSDWVGTSASVPRHPVFYWDFLQLAATEGFGSAAGNFVGNRNYLPPLLERPRSSTPDTDSTHDDDQARQNRIQCDL